jgi:hypothetical protein
MVVRYSFLSFMVTYDGRILRIGAHVPVEISKGAQEHRPFVEESLRRFADGDWGHRMFHETNSMALIPNAKTKLLYGMYRTSPLGTTIFIYAEINEVRSVCEIIVSTTEEIQEQKMNFSTGAPCAAA